LENTLHPGGLKLTARLAEIAAFKPDSRVLEIGCGRGVTTIFIARHYGCSVTGIDISPALIASARDRAENENLAGKTSFIIADAQELPLFSDSFDVVVSECSLSLLPNKERAIDEVRRVLKPRGKITITDLISISRDDEVKSEGAGITPHSTNFPAFFPCVDSAESVEAYMECFARAGFHDLYIEDCSQTIKEAMFRMLLRFGSTDKLLQEIACCCDKMPLPECRKSGGKSSVGYVLFAATKNKGNCSGR
jgi:ubiquinone/menaquinone biosynthesis C-methylase UbiE